MAITQEHVDKLEQALMQGTLVVQSGDERIEFRSVAELERALAYAQRRLAEQDPYAPGAPITRTVATFNRD